ncbi:tetratricopeptide repeat protein [Rubinisphaera italica]|uniref:Photosystem I assembly protein Ycf3 n=1 Tax=Rubinisphaera italica TaxID=2527969 RepID=A0A5C5XIQ5_9PLAN|nr:tetratricopeptide repeat protein [Rubinisphaera italica]TWT63066.1 photosystem I assembly protein Ycf3 [Rubinisphaera italica]
MIRSSLLAILFITTCTLIVYANAFSGEFFQDDFHTLLGDYSLHLYLWPPSNVFTDNLNTRGFTMWTFAVNDALSGSTAFSFHIGNVLIHLLSSLLVYWVVRQSMTLYCARKNSKTADPTSTAKVEEKSAWTALIASVLFAVHPIHIQAVTYLSQRSEALMGLLFLGTIATLIQAYQSRDQIEWKWFWLTLSLLCCLLGMRSKEAMVVAPLLVLWYDRIFLNDNWKSLCKSHGFYYAILWSTLIFNSSWQAMLPSLDSPTTQFSQATSSSAESSENSISVANSSGDSSQDLFVQRGARLSRWEYFQTQPPIILTYVRLVFWPSDLCFDRGHLQPPAPWIFWSCAGVLTVVFLLFLVAIFKAPIWGFLGAWFYINLGPRSSFIALENPYFEYRMYLPILSILIPLALGLFCLAGKLQNRNLSRGTILSLFLVVTAVPLMAVTHLRNRIFSDPVLLWSDTVAKAPECGRAYTNLTRALLLTHQPEDELKAVSIGEKAIRLNSGSGKAFNIYGLALQRTGQAEKAIEPYQKAIALEPKLMHPYLNLGNIYSKTDPQKALDYYTEAMKLAPDDPAVQTNYATTMLFNNVEVAKAEQMLIDLAGSRPTHIDSRLNLGLYYANQGRYREGIGWGEKVLIINPTHQSAIELIKFCQQKLTQPNP